MDVDETMARIGEGIGLSQRGRRDEARRCFAQIWADIGPTGDAFHRCALAHSMADVQEDARDELVWDLRALEAADLVTDERAAQAGVGSPVASFYPSLHLNLGDVYLRLGEIQSAQHHLHLGVAAADALGADPYAAVVRRGLDGLRERLASHVDPENRNPA